MKYTDKEIIEQVKSWNFGFICVNPNAGYSNSKRLIKLQHIINKETITRPYTDAKKNLICFPKYEHLKAKNELNNLNYEWTCLDSWTDARQNFQRFVKLQHSVSKEIITCNYQNAKKNKVCFSKYENSKLIKQLNKLKYGWVCLDTWNGGKQGIPRQVKLKHSISKEVIICQYFNAKTNNILFPKYGDIKKNDHVNKLGLKAHPQYICVSSNCGYKSGNIYVSIKRKDRIGKIKTVSLWSLQKGSNPYNESQNRIEVSKVQPIYERLFKKLKIDYIKEFRLGKKRIDFMFTINKKRYGLEVKQSNKNYIRKNQMETYRKLANLSQYKLEKVFLSDPQGTHSHKGSLSLKELELKLNKLKSMVSK
jgi:hypothetical protein